MNGSSEPDEPAAEHKSAREDVVGKDEGPTINNDAKHRQAM